jgi:glycosyltransferase involved in cell wall biosynthesis
MTVEVTYDVSVVLALNKIDQYAFGAIDSVVCQQDVNHEIILVVNGPQANSIYESLYEKYQDNSNVKILVTSIPQLAFSLNLGVSEASANYIARMDADDIAMPERLSKQLDFMLQNDLDMLGTDVFLINEDDEVIGDRIHPKTKKNIKKRLALSSPFCHPSVMYTKQLFYKARGYNAGFNSEDYDLWLRCMRFQPNWDNMPDKLLKYRIHSAASQGSILAYCEVSGHFLREFLLNPSFSLFWGGLIAVLKTFYRKLRRYV